MLYRAIGLMSGSSLDGLDIVFAEFQEQGGKWAYEILQADCSAYSSEWKKDLSQATELTAADYLLLHSRFGHYLGEQVNHFIEQNQLQYKVGLIASHGHTTFHIPSQKMTAQLGDGAAIASVTGLPVVSDLRAMDVANGGQGAPIVPMGEKILLSDYDLFLNIGGIANISCHFPEFSKAPPKEELGEAIAFDVCPANRVLNLLAEKAGKEFDDKGAMAASGNIDELLLSDLNQLDYYKKAYPKSLANSFGIDIIYPLIKSRNISIENGLRTYTEHVAVQISQAITSLIKNTSNCKLLVTGGGAFNDFLISRLGDLVKPSGVEITIPDQKLVQYKEALIMAFLGVLRWREESTVLSSVTGATRSTIGGALWIGQEA
ncbi:MAG: anhydro-N-acetylmuramic acid kinase [Chitinophagales bacterium]|nr:anhydro-N-acetylmuramic acid kinase [Chitinophagales bacterium]